MEGARLKAVGWPSVQISGNLRYSIEWQALFYLYRGTGIMEALETRD
jgi:hypothetical protein